MEIRKATMDDFDALYALGLKIPELKVTQIMLSVFRFLEIDLFLPNHVTGY